MTLVVGSFSLDVVVSLIYYIIHLYQILSFVLYIKYATENSDGILMIVLNGSGGGGFGCCRCVVASSHIDVNLFLNSVRICVTRIEIKNETLVLIHTLIQVAESDAVDFYFVWLAKCETEV